MTDEVTFTSDEYLDILELCFEAANSLEGVLSRDGRLPDCQGLALKIFAHAASAYWLGEGTKSPVPLSKGGASFTDFASVAVIARSALETLLTLSEVFFAPQTDDEFEFNYCLWHLAGRIVQEGTVPIDSSLHDDYKVAQEQIAQLRDRLQATDKYATLTARQKQAVLAGVRSRSLRDSAIAAGLGPDFIRRMYRYYSSYVHADGLSSDQLITATTLKDQRFHLKIHLLTIMLVMSKMILGYEAKFPEAAATCARFPRAHERAKYWSSAFGGLA